MGKIDKARKVMKERLGEVRTWDELPVSSFSRFRVDTGNAG